MCGFSSRNWFFSTKFVQLAVAGKRSNTVVHLQKHCNKLDLTAAQYFWLVDHTDWSRWFTISSFHVYTVPVTVLLVGLPEKTAIHTHLILLSRVIYWASVEMFLQSLKFNGAFWKTKGPKVQAGILFYKIPCIDFFSAMLGGYPVDTCWLSQKKHFKNKNHVNFLFWARSLEWAVLEVSTTWLRLGQAFTSRTLCSLGNTLHVSHWQIIVFCMLGGVWDWVSQGQSF